MIQLDINYDPDIPDEYQNSMYEQGKQAEADYNRPRPRFPYRGGGVNVLGFFFHRERCRLDGPDPYAGERWTLKVGSLSLTLCSLVVLEVRLTNKRRTWFRACACEWKQLPRWSRLLWGFLEERYEWWESHTEHEHSLEYYE